jgi:hypothetical protein
LWSIHLTRNSNGQRKEDKIRRNPSILPLRLSHALPGSLRTAHLPLAHPRAPASRPSTPAPCSLAVLALPVRTPSGGPARLAPARSPLSRVRARQSLPPPCLMPLCPGRPTHACAARPVRLRALRLRFAMSAARMGGCPMPPLPWDPPAISLFLVLSPYSPMMHAPRPPIFSASRRTACKQQSLRPRQLPPLHRRVCSMAALASPAVQPPLPLCA